MTVAPLTRVIRRIAHRLGTDTEPGLAGTPCYPWLVKLLVTGAVGAAVLVLSACSGSSGPNAEPGTSPEPPLPSTTTTAVDERSQTGTWVRVADWSSVSGLTGQALYDKMCTLESEISDWMGDPVRTRRVGEFDREQFARERVEKMRSDSSWQTTFSPTNQELMVKAVLSAGRESC